MRVRMATRNDLGPIADLFNRMRDNPFICQPREKTKEATPETFARFLGEGYRMRIVEDPPRLSGFLVDQRERLGPGRAKGLYLILDWNRPTPEWKEAARHLARSVIEAWQADGQLDAEYDDVAVV